jgi:predicted acylesterase/phospholipase RssA
MNTQKDYFITFSGGATYGAYHIGAAKRLLESKGMPKTVSGTSMGAIIALLVGTNQLEQAEEILTQFCNVRNILSTRSRFPFNFFTGFYNGGFFTQNKIKKMITDVVTLKEFKNSDTEMIVQTTNISNYQGVSFSSREVGYKNFIDAVLASAAIPLLYEPKMIWNDPNKRFEWFIDGFVSDNIPVRAIYDHMNSKNSKAKNNEHYIVVCSPPVRIENIKKQPNVYEVSTKTIGALLYNFDEKSLQRGFEKHWQSKRFKVLRNMIQYFNSPLDFDGEKIKEAIYGGYKDMDTLLIVDRGRK